MRAFTAVSVLALLPECGDSYGNIKAVLLLQSSEGGIREFDLGNRESFKACAAMARYELENGPEVFWANPEFTYGGYKGGDDWMPYKAIGFSCFATKIE